LPATVILVVLSAAISPAFFSTLALRLSKEAISLYLRTSLRDLRGLYARVRSGEVPPVR